MVDDEKICALGDGGIYRFSCGVYGEGYSGDLAVIFYLQTIECVAAIAYAGVLKFAVE